MDERYKEIVQFLSDSTRQPATQEELARVEKELGVRFPESYRAFQLEYGDFCHEHILVYTVGRSTTCCDSVVEVRRHIHQHGDDAFFQAFNGEIPPIPSRYIPFSYAGYNYYCFDIQNGRDGKCPVVFWHTTMSSDDVPEVVAEDFIDWFVDEMGKIEAFNS